MKKHTIALLALSLTLQTSGDVQLVPAGEFVGRDGRPGKGLTWKLPDANGRALAARLNHAHESVHFNFDYEHQALLSEANGQAAPAAGWASTFEWRDGVGLFALNVQWTARARQMIEADEYRYISPAIAFDTDTGEVFGVVNASLTNIPNLDINPVAQERIARLNANFTTTQEDSMNKVLAAMLAALGLPVTEATTEQQAVSAIATLKTAAGKLPAPVIAALGLAEAATEAEAVTAVATLKAEAAKVGTMTTEIATLKSTTGNPDPSKFVALEKFTEISTEVARLRAESTGREVDELINQARAEGKCTPVVEGVWRDIGKVNIAQLRQLIKDTPGNPALAGQSQVALNKANPADPKAPGTPEELAMCKNLGLTLEQFRSGADT